MDLSALRDPIAALTADLARKPDGVLESLAERHGVPLRAVLDALPEGQAVAVEGGRFAEVWGRLAGWGTVLLIVHTRDGVFEIRTALPPGEPGRGFFNVHGDAPFGGHLRADRCAAIYGIDRPFFGRRSCSLVFVNREGEAMFKVFVVRGPDRALDPDQLARFEALRASFEGGRGNHVG